MHDLKRFRNLQRIWLNGNKFRRLGCFQSNFYLTEVYLQDNMLIEVNGLLRHLTCLEVLMLNGNQLTKLTDVVHELRAMQRLHDLNLFNNPLAQDYDYRSYVIHRIKSLKILDRREVLQAERIKAQKKYEPDREMVKETVSFGRRVDGPPQKVFYPPSSATFASPDTDNVRLSRPSPQQPSSASQAETSSGKEALESAIEDRSLRRSIVQYSTFDWSSVQLSEDKRLGREPAEQPRILTVRFR
ncbi:leucine-rich repeat-containing protein 72 isoform X2 [Nematostella vectensis]|nr:leucine-rich repeat-containing protein 72 isoform X2 [Nematostella vectensis]